MRGDGMRESIDVSDCREAQAWAHSPGALGLSICCCGTAGVLVAERGSGGSILTQIFRHNFYQPPVIQFEPDAVAVASDGTVLGPGLHRAIEGRRYVEHNCRSGAVVSEFEERAWGE